MDYFPKDQLIPVKTLLSSPQHIVITTHYKPDGDAMGSSLAMYNYLQSKGHRVDVVVPGDYPDFLAWLPGNDIVINFERETDRATSILNAADLTFCLDFSQSKRVEKMEDVLLNASSTKILIDHHTFPGNFCEHNFVYTSACATAELIYYFIEALGEFDLISKETATCIYTGIMTDTNSFRISSMKASTHRVIAAMMEAGAVNYQIHESIYDTSTENRLRLMGYSLYEKLRVVEGLNTCILSLSEEELARFSHQAGDTEGLVNYGLSIDGVKLSAFFYEQGDIVKLSLRSKGVFSAQEIAYKFFDGGGHLNAAGGNSTLTLAETITKFENILPIYKDELNA